MERRRPPASDTIIDPTIPDVDEEWEDSTKSELRRALAYIHVMAVERPEDTDTPPHGETRNFTSSAESPLTSRALIGGVRDLLEDRLTVEEVERRVVRIARGETQPRVVDPTVEGAYRLATEVLDRMGVLRDALLDAGIDADRRDTIVAEIRKIHFASRGGSQLSDGAVRARARAEIINTFEFVAHLHLPEVLASLCAARGDELDRATWFLRPLLTDASAVRAMIAVRWPDLAERMADDTIVNVLAVVRSPRGRGTKWAAYADLSQRIGLYVETTTGSEAALETVRRQYNNSDRKLGGDAFDRGHRMRIWARLAEFFAAAGLGVLTADDFNNVWREKSDR